MTSTRLDTLLKKNYMVCQFIRVSITPSIHCPLKREKLL